MIRYDYLDVTVLVILLTSVVTGVRRAYANLKEQKNFKPIYERWALFYFYEIVMYGIALLYTPFYYILGSYGGFNLAYRGIEILSVIQLIKIVLHARRAILTRPTLEDLRKMKPYQRQKLMINIKYLPRNLNFFFQGTLYALFIFSYAFLSLPDLKMTTVSATSLGNIINTQYILSDLFFSLVILAWLVWGITHLKPTPDKFTEKTIKVFNKFKLSLVLICFYFIAKFVYLLEPSVYLFVGVAALKIAATANLTSLTESDSEAHLGGLQVE